MSGRITPADVEGLCERAARLMEAQSAARIVCDVGSVQCDLVAVEALARLQLTAKRIGGSIVVRHASGELRDLLSLTGLCGVLPPAEP